MTDQKSSKFGLGMILGAAAGALAGLFLAPKPGRELQEDAKQLAGDLQKKAKKIRKELEDKEPEEAVRLIFGKVSEESMKLYDSAKDQVAEELAMLKENYQDVDKEKYKKLVQSATRKVKKDRTVPETQLKKLIKYLESDFKKLGTEKEN